MNLNLLGLDDKWRDDSPDYPPCAACGKPIGSEAEEMREEDDTYEPEIATRVWRDHPSKKGQKQEMCFHEACARERLIVE
jgi:hypothetical protein